MDLTTNDIVKDYGQDYPPVEYLPLPPVKINPVIEPVQTFDPGVKTDPVQTMDPVNVRPDVVSNYSGIVLDYNTGNPVPYVTVELYSNGSKVNATKANALGEFSFTSQYGDTIYFSSAEYESDSVKASIYENQNFNIAELRRNVKTIDPVVLPPGTTKKNNSWLWLAAAAAVVVSQQKKQVGKIDTGSVVAVGVGALMFIGLDTIKKFLLELGIGQTKEGQDYDDQVSDPGSFWSPGFWKTGGAGTKLLTEATCIRINDQIVNAFGMWNDNEAAVIAAFKQMQTQSQLSFFAEWFARVQGMDLLKWLKGSDIWPDDRLSVKEISIITDYFKGLPKYK